MKSVDYKVPWGRPGDTKIAAQRELDEMTVFWRRMASAKKAIDTTQPLGLADMPHLRTRPKKKQVKSLYKPHCVSTLKLAIHN
jgi:hypothetical protein